MKTQSLVRKLFAITAMATAITLSAAATSVKLLRAHDDGIQPQAVVDDKGKPHLIYFKGDPKKGELYYTRIKQDESFSEPISVTSSNKGPMALGNIRGAQLAVGKNG